MPIRGSRRPSRRRPPKLLHGQQNILYHEPGLRLYDRLRTVLPGGPWQAFLSNSGRGGGRGVGQARPGRDRPAGDHGVPLRLPRPDGPDDGADDRQGRLPRRRSSRCPGSVYHTAYPYCYRAPGGAHRPDACTCDWEAQLDLTFHQFIYPDRVAAIIIEPVLGEGGYIVPPPGFLPRLREITREHGILLIADEVQTGFGRTGEMFAVRHWDVEPDILVMAKGIASGLPLSGHPRTCRAHGGLEARAPTAARTAATSSRARPPTPRSMSSRTKGSSPTPGSVATSSSPASRRSPARTRRSATCAASA